MRLFRHLLTSLLLLTALCATAQELVAVPPLASRVTDNAGMLTPEQRRTLENVLQEYETRTGSQIAVLLVPSTAPEAIEQYGIRVADAWKLGRKGVDDGVLLLVAKDNPKALRRLRIEAGRGVQGSLTDAQSKRVLEDVIAPHFRQGDYYGGLSAGVSAIASLIDKEHLRAPTARSPAAARNDDDGAFLPLVFFTVVALGWMMSRARRSRRTFSNSGWNSGWGSAAGVILGEAIGRAARGDYGGSGGGFGGGGFGGGGGTFDGGGASGDW